MRLVSFIHSIVFLKRNECSIFFTIYEVFDAYVNLTSVISLILENIMTTLKALDELLFLYSSRPN